MSDKEIAMLAAWVDGNCPKAIPKMPRRRKLFRRAGSSARPIWC